MATPSFLDGCPRVISENRNSEIVKRGRIAKSAATNLAPVGPRMEWFPSNNSLAECSSEQRMIWSGCY